jgi:predicted acyltransferase
VRYAEVPFALQTRRVISLDALRGFSFVWILGGEGAVLALAEMSKGKGGTLGAIGAFLGTQLTHSDWDGFHFYDLIFPLFLLITGVTIPLSLPRLVEREGRTKAHLRVLRRALILYGLGVIYYGGISQHWDDIRYLGVLQRIAICYLVTALLFLHVGWRGMAAVCVSLLVGYWALMTFVPVPGIGAGSFAPDANLANWIDARYLPGRVWDTTRDPEGLLSTLPAIASCLLGVFAGLLLSNEHIAPARKSLLLIGGGIALVAAGTLWSLQFPIVKYIWTSSFALVAGGCSTILLGLAHQIIDVWGFRRWAILLVWIGANAILLYVVNGLFGFEPLARRLVGGDVSRWLSTAVTPGTGGLVRHLAGLTLVIALAGFLYRRKIFLRV